MSSSTRFFMRSAGFCMIALLMFLPCIHSAQAAVSSDRSSPSKITAVFHCDYPPVSFWDKNTDKASGFLVDMMESIAARAGLQVTHTCRNGWLEIIGAIESGEADLAVLIRTEERDKRVLFSDPLESTYLAFFARTQSTIDPDTEDGLTVGAVRGSRTLEYLKKRGGLKLRVESSYQNGLFSLLAGEVDLFAGEEATILNRAREAGLEDRIKVTGKPFAEGARCFVMRKDSAQLLALLNRALPELKASPDYQRIYSSWYGKPKPYWTVRRALTVSGAFLVIVVSGMALWRYLSVLKINRNLMEQIAERKMAEQALRVGEERYRTLIEQASDGIFITDAEGNYLDVNRSGCRMLGYARDQLLHMNMSALVPPEEQAVIPLKIDELKRGKTILSERTLIRRDGSRMPVEINASMLPDGRFLGMVRDIAERKRAEAALKQSEEKFRTLFEESFDGLFVTSPDGRILDMNKKGVAMFGYETKEEILRLDLARDVYYHPPDRQRIITMVTERGTAEYEVDCKKKTGEKMTAYCALTSVKGPDGAIASYRGIIRDITDHKRSERERIQANAKYAILFEQAGDFIFLLQPAAGVGEESPDFVIVDANKSACEKHQYSREELIGMPVKNLETPASRARHKTSCMHLSRPGDAAVFESEHCCKDGSTFFVEVSLLMAQVGDEPPFVISIERDITERKEAEKMLRSYANRLRALSSRLMEARESERRYIAHELHDEIGQSLTAAKLSLDAVRRYADNDTAIRLLGVQQELNELMVRVRDLSLNLRPSLLDTLGLLPTLQWHFKRFTDQTGIRIAFDYDCEDRRFSMEIETGLYRIIQESLTNIARHAGVQSANVSLSATDRAIVAVIVDKGAGFQLESALESGRSMGLDGMYERVDDLGGTLTIHSQPGAGTQLSVSIPLANGLSAA